ncbi:hypothetical protein QBC36DRAFT_313904 [Triangularia setosa]|uniref:Uncharacterized protein n=1 Tax=Triangularia setosa TaxID=2587417 RepID=A0AAN7A4W8_9PEZI|nr:hypothetical protein QBC36DRAFT_313904 [Podospora setosa]
MSIDLNKLLTATAKSGVFLNRPDDDWAGFDHALQFQATERLWPYLDPDPRETFPKEPQYSEISEDRYQKKRALRLNKANRQVTPETITVRGNDPNNTPDELVEVSEPVYTIEDLTIAALERYNRDTKIYTHDYTKHTSLLDKRQLSHIMDDQPHVRRPLEHPLHRKTRHCRDLRRHQRETMMPDVDEYRIRHQNKQREQTRAIRFANTPQKVEDWTHQWEKAFRLTRKYEASDVSDSAAWLSSLLEEARGNPLLAYWSTNFRMNKRHLIQREEMTFQEVARDIRVDMAFTKRDTGKTNKAAFPVFQGEEEAENDTGRAGRSPLFTKATSGSLMISMGTTSIAPPPRNATKKRTRTFTQEEVRIGALVAVEGHPRGPSRLREAIRSGVGSGPQNKKILRYKACFSAGHELRDCFYVFPERIPEHSHFRSNRAMKQLIQANLRAGMRLSEEVTLLKKEKDNDEAQQQRN